MLNTALMQPAAVAVFPARDGGGGCGLMSSFFDLLEDFFFPPPPPPSQDQSLPIFFLLPVKG